MIQFLKKMNSIGLEIYKTPDCNQYVAPSGYAFYYKGEYQGKIIWRNNIEGYYLDKDEKDR